MKIPHVSLRPILYLGMSVILAVSVGACKDDDVADPNPGNTYGNINDTIPDYILYLSNRKGGPIHQALKELYFVDVENNKELQLTNTDDYENVVKFVYHKPSHQIIFTCAIKYGHAQSSGLDIFSMDTETKVVMNLTRTQDRIDAGTYNITNVPIHSDPEISPDGSKVIYTKMYGDQWDIAVLDVSSLEETTILETSDPHWSWKPRWSPDGSKVLYMQEVNNYWQIFLMNADGTDQKRVSTQLYAEGGQWSPDGKHILFLSSATDRESTDLFTADASGNNLKQLTFGGKTSNAAWSNDSKTIAYKLGVIDLGAGDIYTIQSDGSLNQRLTSLYYDFSSISWSPNDDKLLFQYPIADIPEIYMMTADGETLQQITHAGFSSRPQWIDVNLFE